ncbi:MULTISPECIES: hypothetical protein [Klebsiella/Raoultella group]|uniref:hypothetical protein n=1 Tax=Klebsiella/Raoultella group TaxID=2890311 RepID=UPI0010ADCE89|nr:MULTISPECIES: hypothetical protein [Klebsiella/Raoultella group]QGA60431.1 hypothetical protein GHA50_08610 [Klebsiella pneumoniae]TJZ67233.1 hypothetical protein FA013_12070 [Raoultella planticola]HCM4045242.1 hypothetical protein [Klebsiella quasipneumoniae subsp. quasipneumoniae]
MSDMQLIDAQYRVKQAQALLSIWLEGTKASERDIQLICALISLLQDVPEAIKTADEELADYVLCAHREKRQ